MLRFVSRKNLKHKSYVQNWIRNAINLSVSQLVLDFRLSRGFSDLMYDRDSDSDYSYEWYDSADDSEETDGQGRQYLTFHLLDIGENCVKVLKLYDCYLKLPPKTDSIKFVSLKSLELEVIEIEGSDICNLVERCVNLQMLKFKNVDFEAPEKLRFYSATIKELYLECCLGDSYGLPFEVPMKSFRKPPRYHSNRAHLRNNQASESLRFSPKSSLASSSFDLIESAFESVRFSDFLRFFPPSFKPNLKQHSRICYFRFKY